MATLSLVGPTQVATLLQPGLTATGTALGNLKITIPLPPAPPIARLGAPELPEPPPPPPRFSVPFNTFGLAGAHEIK